MPKVSLSLAAGDAHALRTLMRRERLRLREVIHDALRLYLALPHGGRKALRTVRNFGTPEDWDALCRQLARIAAGAAYDTVYRRIMAAHPAPALSPGTTAEDARLHDIAWSLLLTGPAPDGRYSEEEWATLLRGRALSPDDVQQPLTPEEEAAIAEEAIRLTRPRGRLLPRWLPAVLAQDGYVGDGDETTVARCRMRVLSAPKVQRYHPGEDEIAVVIRSRGAPAAPLLEGWRAVHHVEADDRGRFAWTDTGVPLSREDALGIVAFVTQHLPEARALVIACDAGVSRSRSVAAALAVGFGLPYRWTVFEPTAYAVVLAASAPTG